MQFYCANAMLARYVLWPVTVTSWCSTKMAKCRITETDFCCQRFWYSSKSNGVTMWSRLVGDFRPVSHYSSEMVQDRTLLLYKANRDLYALYCMVLFPVTQTE